MFKAPVQLHLRGQTFNRSATSSFASFDDSASLVLLTFMP
jgi:hypothetical protein